MSQRELTFPGSPLTGTDMLGDIQEMVAALASNRSGTSRPSDIQTGEIWLDTTSATAQLLKFWDGANDITLATINATTNTVTFTGTATSGANSNITSLTGLTTPLSVAQGGTGGATASAARTALGAQVADADTCISDVAKGYTAQHTPTVYALTSASTITFNNALTAYASVTLGHNATLGDPANKANGQAGEIVVTGASTYTLGVHANWKMADGTAVALAPAAGKKTFIYWECDGTDNKIVNVIQEA